MYGMRYGALPVTRHVGGLSDTVIDADNDEGVPATGFVFDDQTPDRMGDCIDRAVGWYHRRRDWQGLRRSAMSRDFSWDRSAHSYIDAYCALIRSRRNEERCAA